MMRKAIIQFIPIFLFLQLGGSFAFSQQSVINPSEVTGLQVDKREVVSYKKNEVGPATFWKDSVVFGFSFLTSQGAKYFSLTKIGDFGKFKKPLLDCTIGHEPAHRHAKGAITAKYVRKVSWLIAFGGVIPFLITFYDNPNFENQKMRWIGGGMMIGGLITARLGQLTYESKIAKACRTF